MIEIIISGEGTSDVGYCDNKSSRFVFGPVTYLTQNILHSLHKFELNFHFKSRDELKRYPITLKGKKKKEKLSATAKGHSNLAYKLAYLAKDKGYSVAILMRDADNRKFEDVYEEIKEGFQAARFENGVPAVPVPKSEAWLICCLEPDKSLNIEICKEEMKILLKKMLSEKGMEDHNNTWCEIAGNCDTDKIKSRSFCRYIKDLKQVSLYFF